MTDAQATILAIAAGLAFALVLGASLRRRRTVGYVVEQPFDEWTDAELDRLYAGIMADEEGDDGEILMCRCPLPTAWEIDGKRYERDEQDEHEEWGFV